MPLRTPGNRVIQGLLLCAGAALLQLSAGTDRIAFFWTPLIIGVTYLLAATVDGPCGGYWATALALTGWGLAVAYLGEVRPLDVDVAGAYLSEWAWPRWRPRRCAGGASRSTTRGWP